MSEETKKRPAIISDLDGTLMDKHPSRGIYDESKCHLDLIVEPVAQALAAFQSAGYAIVLLSGRHESARSGTIKCLEKNAIHFDDLFMRRDRDNRKDSIIKKELYREFIEPKYDVLAVIDDRLQVIRMWVNELGLFVFNVNQQNVEF